MKTILKNIPCPQDTGKNIYMNVCLLQHGTLHVFKPYC